jgi:hypothetical protein
MSMAFEQRSLDDYVDVAQRITDFREQYPEGSLRPWNPHEPFRFMQAQGADKNGELVTQSFVVVVAAAYRHGLDDNPGIGMAWEVFPGRTPYTRGSELQNAETSAWGRAIIAVGASDSKRGVASREEVRNRAAERDPAQQIVDEVRQARRRPPEVDEHGAATDAEIVRMTTGPEGTQRLRATPADDPWQTNPPVADSRPKPAGWLLHDRFAALGIFDRAERLAQCSEIIGRTISSSNELEPGEVAAILEALQKREVPA